LDTDRPERRAPVLLLMDAVTMVVARLSVTAPLQLVLLFVKVVTMMMDEVFLSLSSPSLLTSPPTLTPATEACSAR